MKRLFRSPALVAMTVLLAITTSAAQAAIIVVNTLADELNNDGDCSLREAFHTANTNVPVDACTAGNSTGIDAILFSINGEITLSSGLTITQALTIIGNGPTLTRLGRPTNSCCFNMITVNMGNPAHDLSLSQLALYGYRRGSDLPGAALRLRGVDRVTLSNVVVWNHGSSAIARTPWDDNPNPPAVNRLVVEDSEFLDNQNFSSAGGAAIYLNYVPSIIVRRSRFIGNIAHFQPGFGGTPGGAIRFTHLTEAEISDSLFEANKATGHSGGAIDVGGVPARGRLSIVRSTFVANRSADYGEALRVSQDLDVEMVNTTLVDNGQAIMVVQSGALQISHSTLLGPTTAGGIVHSRGSAQIRSSLLYRSDDGGVLCTLVASGTVTTGGFNRYRQGDTSCSPGGSGLPIEDPRLLPLEDYGGPVPTLLPRIDSALIDNAGFNCTDGQNNPISHDARGFPRPVASSGGLARCDVGAVEWNPAFDDYIFKHGFNR